MNCRLVLKNLYNQPECSQQEFRKQLSRELLQNKYQLQSWSQRTRKSRRMNQKTIACFHCPKIICSEKPLVYCKTAYIQLVCSGYGKCRIMTYCPCSPGKVIFTSCFVDYIRLLENENLPCTRFMILRSDHFADFTMKIKPISFTLTT